jgi:deoxyuridine 5'-triphosphate nucleotidohydrolase
MSQSSGEILTSYSEQLRFWLDPAARAAGSSLESPRMGDAGFDLRASRSMVIEAGIQALVSTGLYCAIPLGWVGLIKDRSSMALRGLHTHAGVIDASYRGEIKILIANRSGAEFSIREGDKIAQMVILPHLAGAQEVGSLEE